MKRIILLTTIVLSLLLISSNGRAEGDDWQYWSAYSFNYKITDKMSFILNPSFRLLDDLNELRYWESRQGLSFKPNSQWDINVHYLHGESKNNANKWINENRIELQPTFKWNVGELKFSNRFRLEYRIVNGTEKWRYRNKIKLARG